MGVLNLEYPVHCRNCGADFEDEDAIQGSLDWYDEDPDTFCPHCYSDDLRYDKPREDKYDA